MLILLLLAVLQMSVHTAPGCTMPSNYGATGTPTGVGANALNCDAIATGDTGCGLRSAQPGDYGAPYNSNSGGVHISAIYLSPSVPAAQD
jgi:hypothetical protein